MGGCRADECHDGQDWIGAFHAIWIPGFCCKFQHCLMGNVRRRRGFKTPHFLEQPNQTGSGQLACHLFQLARFVQNLTLSDHLHVPFDPARSRRNQSIAPANRGLQSRAIHCLGHLDFSNHGLEAPPGGKIRSSTNSFVLKNSGSRTGFPQRVRFSKVRLRMRAFGCPQRIWGSPRTRGAAMETFWKWMPAKSPGSRFSAFFDTVPAGSRR